MSARKKFDKFLSNHLKLLKKRNEKFILTGDLNVNPRVQDSHPLAFLQCAKLKKNSGLREDPGCSYQEVSMYHDLVKDFEAVNVWEHLKPNSKQEMTWHSTLGMIQLWQSGLKSKVKNQALICLIHNDKLKS